ncbi:hypothetical protein ACOMHN_067697 [Nucella lapillus]
MTFAHPNGNVAISKGFRLSATQQQAKLKSLANASDVVIEEANEVSEAGFRQLDDTLRRADVAITVVLIFNGIHARHWICRRFFQITPAAVKGFYTAKTKEPAEALAIHGTYHDNRKNINDSTARRYERYAETDPRHYFMEIQGLVGETVSGRVFDNYSLCSAAEYDNAKGMVVLGMDIGFSDPTTLVAVKISGRAHYVRTLIYDGGMLDEDIIAALHHLQMSRYTPIYVDPSAPRERLTMRKRGYNARKANNAILWGLKKMKTAEIHIVEDGKGRHLLDELEGYAIDAVTGRFKGSDHAIDAWRYAVASR